MPTGYTASLSDGEQTFPDFAIECARAFGALVTLRDEPGADIPERFEPSSYHREELHKADAERDRWIDMTDDHIAADLRRVQAEVAERRDEITRAADTREKRYRAMIAEVEAWTPPTPEHHELKTFMLQQLNESIRFDCSTTYLPEIPSGDVATWRTNRIAKAEADIAYHAAEYAAEVKRAANQTAWVQELRASLGAAVTTNPSNTEQGDT